MVYLIDFYFIFSHKYFISNMIKYYALINYFLIVLLWLYYLNIVKLKSIKVNLIFIHFILYFACAIINLENIYRIIELANDLSPYMVIEVALKFKYYFLFNGLISSAMIFIALIFTKIYNLFHKLDINFITFILIYFIMFFDLHLNYYFIIHVFYNNYFS